MHRMSSAPSHAAQCRWVHRLPTSQAASPCAQTRLVARDRTPQPRQQPGQQHPGTPSAPTIVAVSPRYPLAAPPPAYPPSASRSRSYTPERQRLHGGQPHPAVQKDGAASSSARSQRYAASPVSRGATSSITACPPNRPPATAVATQRFEKCQEGSIVQIGHYKFQCHGMLGRGSFSEVYAATTHGAKESTEAAIKDITCKSQEELQQALFEAHLLSSLSGDLANRGQHEAMLSSALKIPLYLAHQVDQSRAGEWHVRMAMTRVPGEALDTFLKRTGPGKVCTAAHLRRSLDLAAQLILQIGPTLERVSEHAWHRDVNSHNILICDETTAGSLSHSQHAEKLAAHASFCLIDFGLAVEVQTWPTCWKTADIGGDCRYWPPSSWLMSFYGAEAMKGKPDLCRQYQTRLDIYGLAVTALELLCIEVLGADRQADVEQLPQEWKALLRSWASFWSDVSRWHSQVYDVFSRGGDITPLYTRLAQECVVDKVLAHVLTVRENLRACAKDAETGMGHRELLCVLAEMLDEGSQIALQDMILAVDPGPGHQQKVAPPRSPIGNTGPLAAAPRRAKGHSLQAQPPALHQHSSQPVPPVLSPSPSLLLPAPATPAYPSTGQSTPTACIGQQWPPQAACRSGQGPSTPTAWQWYSPGTVGQITSPTAGSQPVQQPSRSAALAQQAAGITFQNEAWRGGSHTPQMLPRGPCPHSYVPSPTAGMTTPSASTRPTVTRAVSVQPAARRPEVPTQSRSYACPVPADAHQPPMARPLLATSGSSTPLHTVQRAPSPAGLVTKVHRANERGGLSSVSRTYQLSRAKLAGA
mmetsp:Transcript_8929/g.16049  ORF Transcript_8929/g.16049 Transcript_8929/m.16049 type:complete len:814 (-) Transcript_8929:104-2545(-)